MYWLLIFHTKDDPVAWDLSQSSHFWMDHKYITSLKQGYFFIVPKKKRSMFSRYKAFTGCDDTMFM